MRILVTGATGQDGGYLCDHLVDQGHDVFGMVRADDQGRRAAPFSFQSLTSGEVRRIPAGVEPVFADMLSQYKLERVIRQVAPDRIYHLAAVTAPGGAWGTIQPNALAEVTALGVVRLLEATLRWAPDARVVHASSSAVYDPHRYGLYGISKRFAHEAVTGFQDRLHVANAILYSHTSPRQDPRFVAPTIARTIKRIRDGSKVKFTLTEVGGARDWGWAPDFVTALPLITEAVPGDYVVATGATHTVADFVQAALDVAGLAWHDAVRMEGDRVAPAERPADLSAVAALGWKAQTSFLDIVARMMAA